MHAHQWLVLAASAILAIACLGACADIFDSFKVASESLGPELYRIASFDSILNDLIGKGVFPQGIGTTRSTFTVGNVLPEADEPDWDEVTANLIGDNGDPATGTCLSNYNDVTWGFNEATHKPVTTRYRGPVLCKNDAYFQHNLDAFLASYVDELARFAGIVWGNRLYVDYVKLTPKMIASALAPILVQSNLTLPASNSQLTQQMLDKLAVALTVQFRANQPDGKGYVSYGPQGPLYTLQIGVEASQQIKQNNAEFRKDIRYSDPNLLLYRLGATEAVKNFKHLPWVTPPRYRYDGSKYIRINTFSNTSGTKGDIGDLNPDYLDPSIATHEGALILSPYVMQADIVEPAASHPGGVKFDPMSYMGQWMFKTGNDAIGPSCYDPLHEKGRHFAVWEYAPKPLSTPKSGVLIIFKRCPVTDFTTVTCS